MIGLLETCDLQVLTYYLERSTSLRLGVHREEMITNKELGWRKLFLILTVLPCCRSLQVSIPDREYEAASGGEVTMTCSFTPARPVTDTLIITWEAYPENTGEPMQTLATYFLNTPVNIAPKYEGRASLEINQQVSTLRLSKLTVQDSRSYQCGVLIPNDDEGVTAATTSLLVLVPPSPPICKIQGEASYFNNISLTCMSEDGSPQPAYEWKSFSVKSTARPFPAKTTEKAGVLSLYNISIDTSGFFICTSTNRVGSSSCNLTLAVTPGSMNIGSTAGIIVGVLAGVVLLGIVAYCCCKKKGKKEEYAEGSPGEVAYYDNDAAKAREQYWDDKRTSRIAILEVEIALMMSVIVTMAMLIILKMNVVVITVEALIGKTTGVIVLVINMIVLVEVGIALMINGIVQVEVGIALMINGIVQVEVGIALMINGIVQVEVGIALMINGIVQVEVGIALMINGIVLVEVGIALMRIVIVTEAVRTDLTKIVIVPSVGIPLMKIAIVTEAVVIVLMTDTIVMVEAVIALITPMIKTETGINNNVLLNIL
ncbi:hypothetical protein CesoFtcFv8_013652 [Champsocephalus esox]|uniref:Ig-like domain-containing protein n=1 Tax=Champsocephalus esox TaxID=159716 RepID=A0AAN8BRT5_9TELE|nr:hypothetical protein CesoFtcFv8_013652 [Champsocephalus esox]